MKLSFFWLAFFSIIILFRIYHKVTQTNKNSEMCRRMFKFVCGNWKDDRLMKDGKMIFVESW